MNVHEDLKAYVDNELDAARRAEIAEAMTRDADLARQVVEIESLSKALQTCAQPITATGMDRIQTRLTSRKPTLAKFHRWELAVGVAAVLALFFVGVPNLQQRPRSSDATAQVSAPTSSAAKANAPSYGAKMPDTIAAQRSATPRWVAGSESKSDANVPSNAVSGVAQSPSLGVTAPKSNSLPYENDLLVVRTATMDVAVPDVDAAAKKVDAIVRAMGGRVMSLRSGSAEGQPGSATMTIRIPVDKFDAGLAAISGLGDLKSQNLTGDDVTGQVVDLDQRLKSLRAEEEQYRTMLGRAKALGQILNIKERLSAVRADIETLDAQAKRDKTDAAFSSIDLSLQQRPTVGDKASGGVSWSDDAWANSVNGLKSASRFLGIAAIWLFAYSPIWLPLAAIGWILVRRFRR